MDSIKIYKDYFKKKRETIISFFECVKGKGASIDLWGAGRRGKAFLDIYDRDGIYIDVVFDSDSGKCGKYIDNVHMVKDYRDYLDNQIPNVIVVADPWLEYYVRYLFCDVPSVFIISIDHIIEGDLTVDDIMRDISPDLSTVRTNSVCAVTITYNPSKFVMDNIASYADSVDKLYIFDNTINCNIALFEEVIHKSNVTYISYKENRGLSAAINETVKLAKQEGFDWLITFDQDSYAEENMIDIYRKFINSYECHDEIAIVAPLVNDMSQMEYVPLDKLKKIKKPFFTYMNTVVQSGMMHRLEYINQIGEYDEDLFIQDVDYDFCCRCHLSNFKIIRLNHAILQHNLGDGNASGKNIDGKYILTGKFSPLRYYYIYRNALYCRDKYKISNPIYASSRQDVLDKLDFASIYDGDVERNKLAIALAKEDVSNNRMGKASNRLIEILDCRK